MFVLFQLPSFLFLFLLFLSRTEVYDCSLFWWLDCVIHKFWIPIFIVHHFLCEHHYSLYTVSTTGWKRNIKWMQNALMIYLLSEGWSYPKRYWAKKLQRETEQSRNLLRWQLGGEHEDLLPRCRLFVLCGDAVNKIPSCGGAVFLILNLRHSVKRNNLQTLCGVVVYHMAVVTKTEKPGFLVDELNPIQAMGLLRSPSL